ncbi:hypothetical protein JCM10449v2_007976 [Rhodotorula kratochvilovae]
MPFTQPLVPSPSLSAPSPSSSSAPASPALSHPPSSAAAPAAAKQPTVGLGVTGAEALGVAHSEDAATRAGVTSPLELTQFVDTLLNDLEARFDSMSTDVLSRLNSLSTRVDSLETSLADLMSGTALPPAQGLPAAGQAVSVNGDGA